MVTTTDLVSYYKLDENAANTTVADAHASNTLTASTNTSNLYDAAGQINSAFDLNGTSETLGRTVLSELSVSSDYSISCWINTDAKATNDGVFIANSPANENRIAIAIDDGELRARSYGGAGNDVTVGGTYTVSDGTWANVILNHNSDNSMELYLNNSLVTGGSAAVSTQGTVNFKVGANTGTLELFDGKIDELAIFDALLSSQDRTDLYNSGNGLAYPFTTVGIDETDTTTISENLTIARSQKTITIDETDTTTLSENLTIIRANKIVDLSLSDTTNLSDDLTIAGIVGIDEQDTVSLSDVLTLVPVINATGVTTRIKIDGETQIDVKSSKVERSQNEFNTTSSFSINFDNFEGRHNDDYSINQEVNILANLNSNPECTIINGIIDDIKFSGRETKEVLTVSGREFGSVLQDIIVSPRIFKETEVSEIVNSLMSQNISNITTNNVNLTTTIIDKITFTNISVFDAIIQLAEAAGFFFYVDTDKDLHFEQKNSISTGVTIGNIPINDPVSHFKLNDNENNTSVLDSIGNNNAISSVNTDTISSDGLLDSSFDLNGVDEYAGENTQLVSGYPFTMCAWVNTSNTTATNTTAFSMVDKDSTNIFYGIGMDDTFKARLVSRNTDTVEVLSTNNINDNNWHLIIGVFESNTSKKLYLDKNLEGEITDSVTFNSLVDRFDIGRWGDSSPSSFWSGKIDDVRMYDFSLTEDQIASIYNNGKGTEKQNPIYDNNVTSARFRTSDQDQFTKVTVQGDRQLTGAENIQTTGTDNTGSVYVMDSKPYNTVVTLSGPSNTLLQPGGVLNINDPEKENIKYLVDFQGQSITLTSGTAAGDNIQGTGSVVIFNYQRSTPLISIKEIPSNFPKHKIITDRNIKDINEASLKAQTFLDEHKDSKIDGRTDVKDVIDLTPGHTVVVNLPNQGQTNKTYAITNTTYEFNPRNNLSANVMSLKLNKKTSDFIDIMKEQVLRLRALEASETDSSITNVEQATSPVGVVSNTQAISTSIGSGFYFNVSGHDILNSPTSLLGDVRGGSIVFQNGVQI